MAKRPTLNPRTAGIEDFDEGAHGLVRRTYSKSPDRAAYDWSTIGDTDDTREVELSRARHEAWTERDNPNSNPKTFGKDINLPKDDKAKQPASDTDILENALLRRIKR